MKRSRQLLLVFLLILAGTAGARARDEVRFRIVAPEKGLAQGESFDVLVRATIAPGWHLYSMDVPPGGPIPTSITLEPGEIFEAGGPVTEPPPIPWFDQNFNMETNYFEGSVDFTVPLRVRAGAAPGDHTMVLNVRFMACTETMCLPPQKLRLEHLVAIVGQEGLSEPQGTTSTTAGQAGAWPDSQRTGAGDSEAAAGSAAAPGVLPTQQVAADQGIPPEFWAYLWFAMTMGGLALLTPCVFPMIPITVSYFTKREAATRRRAIFEAGVYSLGIILTFTLLAFALTWMLGAGGINRLAASPWVNLVIASIFVVFAISLFGAFEIRIPSSWLSLVNRQASERKGVIGILLMALTFSLTSFTCTVPFVGTVMVAALQGELTRSLLGVAAFATVFAAPFFILAVFPSWLHSLPRSGNWMNSIKITMGFLELAAALKFVSNIDLVFQWELITRPVFVTVWLAIALLTAVYLLGWFRFSHESASESVGVGRVFGALLFVSISFYLLRGLIGFPLGELDAFLPPREYGGVEESFIPAGSKGEREEWLDNLEGGLEQARRTNKPVFIDFTGYTCTNCRWMESNIFPLLEVRELFQRYVLVRLYTDGTEPEHEENRWLEESRFGTIALPYYVILSPRDEVIATFPGLTRDEQEFITFLRQGVSAMPVDHEGRIARTP